jgi:hypothetical protein
MLKFADGTRSAKAVPSSVSAVAVNAWSPSSTPPSPPLSSPSAPFDWMGSPWLRGAQGLSGGSTHAVSSGGGGKRMGGLGASLPLGSHGRDDHRPSCRCKKQLQQNRQQLFLLGFIVET